MTARCAPAPIGSGPVSTGVQGGACSEIAFRKPSSLPRPSGHAARSTMVPPASSAGAGDSLRYGRTTGLIQAHRLGRRDRQNDAGRGRSTQSHGSRRLSACRMTRSGDRTSIPPAPAPTPMPTDTGRPAPVRRSPLEEFVDAPHPHAGRQHPLPGVKSADRFPTAASLRPCGRR